MSVQPETARGASLASLVASIWALRRNPFAWLALVGTVIVIAAMTQIAFAVVDHWFERDIETRSRLVFSSLRKSVIWRVTANPAQNIGPYFESLAADERLLALGLCDRDGKIVYATKEMPAGVECPGASLAKVDSFRRVRVQLRPVSVGSFPLPEKDGGGDLLVVNDISFVEQRAREAELYVALVLIGVAGGFALLAGAVIIGLTRSWRDSLRTAIDNLRGGYVMRRQELPVGRDIEAMLAELRLQRRYADGIHVEWSPKALRQLLETDLPGARVIVVSNREPYIHNRTNGGISLQTPASGLVSALEPIMRACGGAWIAHGSGAADRDTVDAHDRVAVPPANPSYTLRRVWLTDEEQDGYYYGLANEGLWPLCHIAFVRPVFRESDWEHYVAVNERFAKAVVQEAQVEDPIVLVQDYHFGLLPRMLRQRLPRATIITFWHIPWPNPETFSIFPWREQIIHGLLGSSILGFHTQFHCNNFIEAIDRFMESRIDRERHSVMLGGRETLVRAYPISIEWPPAAMEGQAPIEECRRAVIERFGLPPEARIGVGIERFDYTKGIVDRMRAIGALLENRPEWRGKFVFLQAAAPTRSKLTSYRELQTEAIETAEAINAKYGDGDYKPIVLSIRHHGHEEVYEIFRAADVCIVSSLHDGMNLVAKEFVSARDDEQGVLLLSSFAGASRELAEALIVNPYDARSVAEALDAALRMPPEAQRARMKSMRDMVRQRNVYLWAAQMLQDAARLRRRQAVTAAA